MSKTKLLIFITSSSNPPPLGKWQFYFHSLDQKLWRYHYLRSSLHPTYKSISQSLDLPAKCTQDTTTSHHLCFCHQPGLSTSPSHLRYCLNFPAGCFLLLPWFPTVYQHSSQRDLGLKTQEVSFTPLFKTFDWPFFSIRIKSRALQMVLKALCGIPR